MKNESINQSIDKSTPWPRYRKRPVAKKKNEIPTIVLSVIHRLMSRVNQKTAHQKSIVARVITAITVITAIPAITATTAITALYWCSTTYSCFCATLRKTLNRSSNDCRRLNAPGGACVDGAALQRGQECGPAREEAPRHVRRTDQL